MRSFLGLSGYYRRFIENYASIAEPLINLTKKNSRFNWTDRHQEAFDNLKQKLVSAPILAYPSNKGQFYLDTDASACSIGAVLSQENEGTEKVIAYGSRVLSSNERNYCVTRRELLAIVWFCEHYKHYLIGRTFTLRTDHGALKWLFSFKQPEGQLARWLERLSVFTFKIQHRPGKLHCNGDALSRRPCEQDCKYCYSKTQGEIERIRLCKELPQVENHKVRLSRTQRKRIAKQKSENEVVLNDTLETDWLQEIRIHQEEDDHLKFMQAWSEKPTKDEAREYPPELKFWWTRWPHLRRENNLWLYAWHLPRNGIEWKIIIPKTLQDRILMELHDTRLGGHFGIEKTYQRLKGSPYYWKNMRASAEQHCGNCDVCFKTKKHNRKIKAKMGHILVSRPLERIALDIMGPLTQTYSDNKYVLVVSDYFTKWTEAYALPDQQAETVASYLVSHFISRFGIPENIHTDQATNFQSDLFKELCRLLQIHQTRTTPWRPQSDGLVERFNRTLGALIRQVVETQQRNWDSYLPILCMAYRSAVHTTTGYTPNRLMLGRELPFPSYLYARLPLSRTVNTYYPHYVNKLESDLLMIYEQTRKHGLVHYQRQKREHDRHSTERQFVVNQKVWLFNPTKKIGINPKLHTFWEPDVYRIEDIISDFVVRISKCNGTGRPRIVHVNYISPVKQPPPSPPSTIANQQDYLSPMEEMGLLPRRSRRLQGIPPL